MNALLSIEDLHVSYNGQRGSVSRALNGVQLQLGVGTTLGILGESGSGKSTLARATLRMLPESAQVAQGKILFEEKELLQQSERQIRQIRGARISIVPQDPGLALNPVIKVGDQIAEVLRAHFRWSSRKYRDESEGLLERVQLRSGERRIYDAYPHQLSGGQQQRVAIAQAIACNPALIIADEPTASLDRETEREILDLFGSLKAEGNTSLILITHDPTILHGFADRVAVLYAGRIVEDSPSDLFFRNVMHPYAKGLLACMPANHQTFTQGFRLPAIEGTAPGPEGLPDGCSFSPRCADSFEKCRNVRPVVCEVGNSRRVECFLYE
jgi:peptide/nickel transport system ATP-binding protein